MDTLRLKIEQWEFLNQMADYVKTIEILAKSGDTDSAYSYQLCFYASLRAISDKYFQGAKISSIINSILISMPIDTDVLYDLHYCLYTKDSMEFKESSNIRHWYYKTLSIRFQSLKNILVNMLQLHSKIVKTIQGKDKAKTDEISKRMVLKLLK